MLVSADRIYLTPFNKRFLSKCVYVLTPTLSRTLGVNTRHKPAQTLQPGNRYGAV